MPRPNTCKRVRSCTRQTGVVALCSSGTTTSLVGPCVMVGGTRRKKSTNLRRSASLCQTSWCGEAKKETSPATPVKPVEVPSSVNSVKTVKAPSSAKAAEKHTKADTTRTKQPKEDPAAESNGDALPKKDEALEKLSVDMKNKAREMQSDVPDLEAIKRQTKNSRNFTWIIECGRASFEKDTAILKDLSSTTSNRNELASARKDAIEKMKELGDDYKDQLEHVNEQATSAGKAIEEFDNLYLQVVESREERVDHVLYMAVVDLEHLGRYKSNLGGPVGEHFFNLNGEEFQPPIGAIRGAKGLLESRGDFAKALKSAIEALGDPVDPKSDTGRITALEKWAATSVQHDEKANKLDKLVKEITADFDAADTKMEEANKSLFDKFTRVAYEVQSVKDARYAVWKEMNAAKKKELVDAFPEVLKKADTVMAEVEAEKPGDDAHDVEAFMRRTCTAMKKYYDEDLKKPLDSPADEPKLYKN
ncbi:unnamed protein product [Amoebophrya sp. A25]|nr:unnamed protein product [Amoebophrya sp. A25]|eukprot:GSA25T00012970001.1